MLPTLRSHGPAHDGAPTRFLILKTRIALLNEHRMKKGRHGGLYEYAIDPFKPKPGLNGAPLCLYFYFSGLEEMVGQGRERDSPLG